MQTMVMSKARHENVERPRRHTNINLSCEPLSSALLTSNLATKSTVYTPSLALASLALGNLALRPNGKRSVFASV